MPNARLNRRCRWNGLAPTARASSSSVTRSPRRASKYVFAFSTAVSMSANVTSDDAAYYPDLASRLELLGQREGDEVAVAEPVGIASFRQVGTIGQARAEGFVDGEVGRQDQRFALLEQRSQGDRGIAFHVVNPRD